MSSPLKSNPNPALEANVFSRFFHAWLSSLINKSHKQGTLHLEDLYDLPDHLQSTAWIEKLEANWLDETKRCPQNPSLVRATLRTMGWRLFLLGLCLLLYESLNIAQPLILTYFMKFFEPCSTMPIWEACLAASAVFLTLFFVNLIFHQYIYRLAVCGQQMKAAYSGLIYRKVLRLSSHAMSNHSTGAITNLLANDANQIELVHYMANYLWVTPIQITLVTLILWHYVKYIAFLALGYALCLLLIQPLLSRSFLHLRAAVLKVTDERVKIMSEIIKSMRIVKMYCWESAFEDKVRRVRKREMFRTILVTVCTSIEVVLANTYIGVTFLLMYGTMWTLNMKFSTQFFTVAYVLLNYTRASSIMGFNMAIRDLLIYWAAQKRIRAFLLLDESQRDDRLLSLSRNNIATVNQSDDKQATTTIELVCHLEQAHWQKNGTFSLKNIVFDSHPGDLICVIGPVGSGKSSLLQTLTGEITFFEGKVRLHGSFCYVPQESWIFSSTVKSNILFGKEFNRRLFERVVRATALDTDFAQLSHGANTLVGDQGVMLSGGQKARVNMARALYRDADIYLLDDPLSAVDTKVSKHLFDKSIKRYLRDKICVLVTHQIQFLQDATRIIVLDNGNMTQMGTYNELMASSSTFAELLEDINQHEERQRQSSFSHQTSVTGSINSEIEEVEEDPNKLPTNTETKEEGALKWQVYISYLRAGFGVVLSVLLIVGIHSIYQVTEMYSNWWLAAWSNDESGRHRNMTHCRDSRDDKLDRMRGMDDAEWHTHRNQRFYVFSAFVASLFVLVLLRTTSARLLCLNTARVLHNKMFKRVIRSPILFFDTNPIGRITNRFTSDVATMDDSLPMTVSDFLRCLFQVLGTISMIGAFNRWSFIPAIIVLGGMLFLRHRFASCSRDLKRLLGTTRSPVLSQLTSTMHGLKVIRSYHAENVCFKEFDHHLDNNIRVSYLCLVLNRWSAMRFDWIALTFIILVVTLSIVARVTGAHFSAVEIALTLTYSLNLMGLCQWTIRQSIEVETQMTSVERILEYCALDQEPSSVARRPPPNWPSQGRIIFENVSMSHSKDQHAPLALHHLSLTIHAAEKIGIVGRTGAGKSSFIQTLFRMGTLVHGHIIIDDIDIDTVALDDVRRRLSIIPQDPVLFTGTMRSNLDQFGQYSDPEIWDALEQVQLKRLVTDVMSNGLESTVSEGGSNLSVGQKQLVCLARAILKKSRILVIDEATANVDNATDELIQKAIRQNFKDCTVLTVAHRLRTVIDNDRILVLSDGKMVEFDTPEVLLSNEHSQFASLVEQTGSAEAEHLRALANSVEPYTKRARDIYILKEEPILEENETDPLVPSSERV